MSNSDQAPNNSLPPQLPIREQVGQTIPVVAVRDVVIFPHTEPVLTFGRPKSMAAVEATHKSGQTICLVTQKSASTKDPLWDDIYHTGVLAKIEKLLTIEGVIHTIVKVISRTKLLRLVTQDPYMICEYEDLVEISQDNDELKALSKYVTTQFKKAVNLGKAVDLGVFMRLMAGVDSGELADQIASSLDIGIEEKQKLVELASVNDRLKAVANHLDHEIRIMELEYSISNKTQRRIDKSMREAILRERKKTIEKELQKMGYQEDTEEPGDPEVMELNSKIKKAGMPPEVKEKIEKELKRFTKMSPHNPERSYLQNYLDWVVEMPWSKTSSQAITLANAVKVLETDHYGLEQAKERIIEYLAVMKLRQQTSKTNTDLEQGESTDSSENTSQADTKPRPKTVAAPKLSQQLNNGPTILCFVGPPGVGKTSIGRSIAKALGREFVRVSLGGIRDEAEIRGHRRTYIGALPGRIIQGIRNAGTKNPVFMLDEIDKLGTDFRGDPSSALLEALDPEQNREFSDHYLEVPFDLSQVMFITTANLLDTIPPALKDRLEVIEFEGYTEDEKVHIASKYLWPKQLKLHSLSPEIRIEDAALKEIVHHYTREAGVRNLERNLATVCRKIARKISENKGPSLFIVTKKLVHEYLGPIKFTSQLADTSDDIGVATGLAYTPVGGNILFIEVALMPGSGKLTLTGHLGQVMKESCKAAFSYVRTRWLELGLAKDPAKNIDVHIHVPEGAVPKDGPSAGVAIATALTSAFAKTPSRRAVAMTGEITLRGRVTEIGGVKQKVIAAHHAGIKTVIMPKANKKDLKDIPDKVKKDIRFVFVDHLDQVLPIALHPLAQPKSRKSVPRDHFTKPRNGHPQIITSLANPV